MSDLVHLAKFCAGSGFGSAYERGVNVRNDPVFESGIIKCSVFYQGFEDRMIARFLAPTATPSLSVSRLRTAQNSPYQSTLAGQRKIRTWRPLIYRP